MTLDLIIFVETTDNGVKRLNECLTAWGNTFEGVKQTHLQTVTGERGQLAAIRVVFTPKPSFADEAKIARWFNHKVRSWLNGYLVYDFEEVRVYAHAG